MFIINSREIRNEPRGSTSQERVTEMTIFQEYRVTPEQVESCQRYIAEVTNQVFYLVPSAHEVGTYYRVNWDLNHGRFGCQCKASANGMNCWHVRAAIVSATQYAEAKRAETEAAARIARETEEAAQAARVQNARPYRPSQKAVAKACKRNAYEGFSLLK